MEKNLELDNVVPSVTLEDKEGYAVDFNGAVITTAGTGCLGAVYEGRPADTASVIAVGGVMDVHVDGSIAESAIAVNSPLTAGGGTAAGEFTLATVGTHAIRAYAREAATTQTTISVMFV